jgi:hypothetical protein
LFGDEQERDNRQTGSSSDRSTNARKAPDPGLMYQVADFADEIVG